METWPRPFKDRNRFPAVLHQTEVSNPYYCIKAVPRVINSRALTGEKPCINKAIHALLMHGYAIFNMPVPGPQNSCRHEICSARP